MSYNIFFENDFILLLFLISTAYQNVTEYKYTPLFGETKGPYLLFSNDMTLLS